MPIFLLILLAAQLSAQQVLLPAKEGSLRFAVFGDSGTGGREQYQVAEQMVRFHQKYPFEFVLMLGDNLYGGESPSAYNKKFETPYKSLIATGVKFYAALGNHDDPNQRFYKLFNMNGERYYSFKPKPGVRFFALDSNYMDRKQLEWLEKELQASGSEWKIPFFHHPIYSSGKRHGSAMELRQVLEPLFLLYKVNVVFAGHEHFYERLHPQKGIYYFTSGGAAKLRAGNIGANGLTAKGFDTDRHFMVVEIAGDEMYFQTISRSGQTVDSGMILRQGAKARVAAAGNGQP